MDIVRSKKNLQAATKKLRETFHSLYKIYGRVPTGILSCYGELLVACKLLEKFPRYHIKKIGGQRQSDILLGGSVDKRIEVKSSTLKSEDWGSGYGVAFNIKKCKQHPEAIFNHPKRGRLHGDFCYFDYLVFVCHDIDKDTFFVFSREEITKIENGLINKSGRFSSATHRLIIPEKNAKINEKLTTKKDEHMWKNLKNYRNRWAKII